MLQLFHALIVKMSKGTGDTLQYRYTMTTNFLFIASPYPSVNLKPVVFILT